ncbi:phosphatases II [Macrolepiota fuliginosa MF-IS2]|uniref:protein-tyrosine-phosphatase n=1 Tax=Macrolepiota fuliginosa MF-IS2 TaxID=1400762 RepID=A0A9P5XDQ6_9AGAR|nr:phosphatases II [Macrolepiota fuliginosa MF-IS2]
MAKRKNQAAPKQSSDAASIIIPNALYLGPCSSASSVLFLTSNSINHVLSIGSTPSPKVDGVTYHRLSLNDSTSSSITPTVNAAVDIINSALRSNRGHGRIFVHCSAGVSRSPTIVTSYLMKQRHMPLKTALGHVLRARPQVSPNSGFLKQLKELEVELFGKATLDIDELPRREADRLALFPVDGGDKEIS